MGTAERLEARSQERDGLLTSIVDLLKLDRRVVAVWLGGSLGRGSADKFSDIDIYVVVSEQYARFVFTTLKEFVSRVPGLLLTEVAPRNAPADGAYLLTLFHGDTGFHQVDWYWVTDRIKEIPTNTRVLFNTAGIPTASIQLPTLADDTFDQENEVARFWALAAISAKKIARGHPWSAIALLGYLRSCVDQISWHIGAVNAAPGHADTRSDPPPGDSLGQLAALKALIREMEDLSPAMIAAGLAPPNIMAKELAPLIDLSDAVISETV